MSTPTQRLLKAAEAEREHLARHRQELLDTRETLRVELERIESTLASVEERESLLDRLVGTRSRDGDADHEEALAGRATGKNIRDEDEALTVLRGPDIRREAVRVLLTHPRQPEAMHYRDWYALLQEAGFIAGGKDPLATFLTQLSRSPAVRKSTQAGVYELDRDAVQRLHRRRDEVQKELRELTVAQPHGGEGAAVRARRTELNTELGRVEKALEEVEDVLIASREPALAA